MTEEELTPCTCDLFSTRVSGVWSEDVRIDGDGTLTFGLEDVPGSGKSIEIKLVLKVVTQTVPEGDDQGDRTYV